MSDVARLAQVSKDTVSRVVNNDPTVRHVTRQAVLRAIEQLDYIPNAAARSLKSARTRTIGVVISYLADSVFHPIIAGIEGIVRDHGYSLLICDSNMDGETEAMNLRTLYERQVEGLIFYPTGTDRPQLDRFQQTGIPVLIMDWSDPTLGFPQSPLRHREAIANAVGYLRGLGHERVAFIATDTQFGRWRAEDFRHVLGQHDLPADPALVAVVADPFLAEEALRAMLGRAQRPTAVMSSSLFLTPGLLHGIYAAGLDIPRDISFITYGDSGLTASYRPPLTAMVTDRTARGRVAAEYVFARLAGEPAEAMLKEWNVDLVIRESCAPVPRPHAAPGPGRRAGGGAFAIGGGKTAVHAPRVRGS